MSTNGTQHTPRLFADAFVGEYQVWADYGGDPATSTGPGPHGMYRIAKVSGPEGSAAEFATLFASAPDLLAALEDMLKTYAPGASRIAEREGEDVLHPAVKRARAAIAKAKGVTP